ncbi:iron ABC transporter permease (plasmid) [Pseudohalocynthiibacter aestuariivivens]|nr:iron ABC transporter permease [Pseudohalocynthiibacter aestuariivivens]QIE48032.1 iron ABC transporter permease [Pseudohalocynthiibacter aestuariivivens]
MGVQDTAMGQRIYEVQGRLPHYRRILGAQRSYWFMRLVFALVVVLIAAPLIPTVYQSFLNAPLYDDTAQFTLQNYAILFREEDFGIVILNTVYFAFLSTIFSLIIAIPLAIIVVKTDIPGRTFFSFIMQWPFFISALIFSFGWVLVYSPGGFATYYVKQWIGFAPWDLYTIPGMAIVESMGLAPIAYVYCANSLRQADVSLEAAARTVGARPLFIIARVLVPMLRPAIVYSSLLIFSMSIEALSVPLILGLPNGIRMFSSFLYEYGLTSINPNHGVLAAAATLVLMVLICLIIVQAMVLRKSSRFISVRGKATRSYQHSLGWYKWAIAAVIYGYLVLGMVIPAIALIMRSFTQILTPLLNPFSVLTLDNYKELFSISAYYDPIVNSVILSAIGAVAVSALAATAALISRRSPFYFRKATEYLVLSTLAIPGTVLSIGLFWTYTAIPWGSVQSILLNSLFGLVIAFGIRALPVAFSLISAAIMQLHEELDRAAYVAGADWLHTFGRVLFRLLLPFFASSAALVFVIMMKEYATGVFLVTVETEVIGTAMLSLWSQGTTGAVASLAVVQIAISLVVIGCVQLRIRKKADA